MREVVLDIETIPCEEAFWKRLPDELKSKFFRETSSEEKAWRKTALDWSLGRIVCIGLLFLENRKPKDECFAGPKEAELVKEFWRKVKQDDYIIGHNVLSFDLPFILARSVVCNVKPTRSFDLRRYSTHTIYDTMQVWSNWDRCHYPKLELLARIFKLEGKSGSGEQIFEWYKRKDWKHIKEYCLQDVRLTHETYRRLKEYGL